MTELDEIRKQKRKIYTDKNKEKIKRQHHENYEKHKERLREIRIQNRDKIKEYNKIYKIANKEKMRIYNATIKRPKHYNMTPEEYKNMFDAQNGLCAICGKKETQKSRYSENTIQLSIDHDHCTGKVRGLLCHHCNSLIGNAKDNVKILRKAIDYLLE